MCYIFMTDLKVVEETLVKDDLVFIDDEADAKYVWVMGKTYPLREWFVFHKAKWDPQRKAYRLLKSKQEEVKQLRKQQLEEQQRKKREKQLEKRRYESESALPERIKEREDNYKRYIETFHSGNDFPIFASGAHHRCYNKKCRRYTYQEMPTSAVTGCRGCLRSWCD